MVLTGNFGNNETWNANAVSAFNETTIASPRIAVLSTNKYSYSSVACSDNFAKSRKNRALIQYRWERYQLNFKAIWRDSLHIPRCTRETFLCFVGPITDSFNVKSTRGGRRGERESISRFNRMRGGRIFEQSDELGNFLSPYTFDICNLAAGTNAGNKVLIDDYNL